MVASISRYLIVNLSAVALASVEALEAPVLVEESAAAPSRFSAICERTRE